jgi:hypothetical protein
MEFKTEKPTAVNPKGYVLTVHTMEGDADDYHQFDIYLTKEQLPQYVIALEVIGKTYPNGRGGSDNYAGPHWELVSDNWNWSGMCDCEDSYDGYSLVYNTGDGTELPVTVILSEKDKQQIADAEDAC